MDLIKILQQLRFFNAALELLMTQETAESLRNSTLMRELQTVTNDAKEFTTIAN